MGLSTYLEQFTDLREYVGVQLLEPLTIGTEYYISAYISRGDSTYGGEIFNCATNKLGFKFSTIKYDYLAFAPAPTDNFAHVYSDDIITDSVNWVQVYGSFIADSAYTYLSIGNFFDDANTIATPCSGTAYYYIDAVCLSTSATTCDVVASVPLLKQQVSQLYPNPASTTLAVRNITGTNFYSILNSTGNTIKQGNINETNNGIDISSIPNGIYFFRLNNNRTYKFFISH